MTEFPEQLDCRPSFLAYVYIPFCFPHSHFIYLNQEMHDLQNNANLTSVNMWCGIRGLGQSDDSRDPREINEKKRRKCKFNPPEVAVYFQIIYIYK